MPELLGLRPKHKFGTVCPAATKQNILTCCQNRGRDVMSLSGFLLGTKWQSGLALGQNVCGPLTSLRVEASPEKR